MTKERKKSIIFTVSIALIAVILIVVFALVQLRSSGKIGSSDSSDIMKEFDKRFNSSERTVIYYASPSCSACSLQTPVLEVISSDYDMDYYYLDSSKLSASQRQTVLETLDIEHATPTTLIVEKGKVVDKVVGYTPGKEYVEFFKKNGLLEEDAVYSQEQYITFIDYGRYEEVINLTDDTNNIVVIGQTKCSHCIAIKPALNAVARDYDIVINYLNLTDLSKEESDSFFETLKTIGYNDPDFVENGSFGTPLILVVKNGQVSNYISGERTTSQLVREFKKSNLI